MKLFRKLVKSELHTRIFIGLIAGIPAGFFLGGMVDYLEPVGDIFLRLIRMIVVPLVFSSLFVGTASLGDIRKLGRIGIKTMGYYLCTTAIAITIGLILGNIFTPGNSIDQATRDKLFSAHQAEAAQKIDIASNKPDILDTLVKIVPGNPVESLAEANMLQIIFFALLLGIAVTMVPEEKGKPLIRFFEALSDTMIRTVHIVMKMAPLGVFALIAVVVGRFGTDILVSLLKYTLVVLLGLGVHVMLTYSTAIRLFAGYSPLKFLRGIRPAQLIAFSTSSSSATLPVTIECCEENLGVSEKISSFVLPLGATINMDGTALYQGVAAIFIAQVYGIPLTITNQLTIVLMATLASIGAAGVPGIGIITLAMVLETIGVPLEGIALILGVDRLIDMCRTTVNITGDSSCALIIGASENELREELPAKD
ncbi:MAG: cation:dicarboxylase symporter family transporter [Candidatus Latescibacteria bacterium]|nr:cation:dicarboxylase symporter family transporter [bacterium]MBD3424541.1 cation:dicarboxylase symporter family transporter [Candidatus Latescibacterota bacterium]